MKRRAFKLMRIAAGTCLLLLALSSGLTAQEAAPAASPEPLTVALTGKYPPFSFYNQQGELDGFDVEVSRLIAAELGRPLTIITTEWDGILAGLLAGKFDAIIGSMAITPERAERVSFSTPYYVSGAQLFVHDSAGQRITSIQDCTGLRIGVVLGETFEHYLHSNHPEIETVTYKGTVGIFQDMLNQRLDGFVTDRLVGMYQIKSAQMPFAPAGELLYEEQMAIPVRQDHPALLAQINTALAALEQRAELARLSDKWFGLEPATTAEGASAAGIAAPGEGPYQRMPTAVVARMLARGFGLTLYVAITSLLLGFLLALPASIVLHGKRSAGQVILRGVVDFLRGTPVLIQLFFVYFGAPQLGVSLSPIGAAIFTLTVNTAAYLAEVIRAGLMSVGPGQRLAGRALGLSPYLVFRLVVWPQAFRVALPSLMNSAVALLKDTALISVISVAEVVREAQSIISVTYQPMQYYFIVALMFFIFTYPLMRLAMVVETRIRQRGYTNA